MKKPFLCHNSADKPAVERLAFALAERRVQPWFDKWEVTPGIPFVRVIGEALESAEVVVVCIGPSGCGAFQTVEIETAVLQAARDPKRLVVVAILEGTKGKPDVPVFLKTRGSVDLREPGEMERLLAALSGVSGTRPASDDCPYRGLLQFEERHSRYFVGRRHEIDELVGRLDAGNRAIVLIGASGSGKSSLVRAGLIPSVRTGELDGEWHVLMLRPGADPCRELAIQLLGLTGADLVSQARLVADLVRDMRRDPQTGRNFVDVCLRGQDHFQLLIVVDQLEELFLLAAASDRDVFLGNLLGTVAGESSRSRLVTTLRADFLSAALGVEPLAPFVAGCSMMLTPMTDEQLREAVQLPAAVAGLRFEPGLVDRLVAAVRKRPAGLPLLQFALRELWNARSGTQLTNAAYDAMNGLAGAVTQRAETILDGMRDQTALVQRMFAQLLYLGDGGTAMRRRCTKSELEALSVEAPWVLQEWITARLLHASNDDGGPGGGAKIEVAHEALIEAWPTLRRWLDDNREVIRLHQELQQDAQGWARHQRSGEYLWQGDRAERVAAHLDSVDTKLSAGERAFLVASMDAADAASHALERARTSAELQAEEAHQARLATAGLLAAGIVHEINNPLTSIVGNIELMNIAIVDIIAGKAQFGSEVLTATDWHQSIVDMTEACRRIQQIIGDLRGFVRTDRGEDEELDVVDTVRLAIRLVDREIRSHVLLVEEFEPVPSVKASRVHVSQVLVNLLLNASQATTNDGRHRVGVRTRAVGDWVEIDVMDNGVGIDSSVRERIFEPFFTTKRARGGLGLGLSLSTDLVRRNHGTLTIVDDPEWETVFRIRLPVSTPDRRQVAVDPITVADGRNPFLVLVIDDEPAVSRALKRFIERMKRGNVMTAASGADAVALFSQFEFDLIICDVMMPGMSGPEVFQNFASSRPDATERFVFCTGGVFEGRIADILDANRCRVLQKPVTGKDLLDVVNAAADRAMAARYRD